MVLRALISAVDGARRLKTAVDIEQCLHHQAACKDQRDDASDTLAKVHAFGPGRLLLRWVRGGGDVGAGAGLCAAESSAAPSTNGVLGFDDQCEDGGWMEDSEASRKRGNGSAGKLGFGVVERTEVSVPDQRAVVLLIFKRIISEAGGTGSDSSRKRVHVYAAVLPGTMPEHMLPPPVVAPCHEVAMVAELDAGSTSMDAPGCYMLAVGSKAYAGASLSPKKRTGEHAAPLESARGNKGLSKLLEHVHPSERARATRGCLIYGFNRIMGPSPLIPPSPPSPFCMLATCRRRSGQSVEVNATDQGEAVSEVNTTDLCCSEGYVCKCVCVSVE